MNHSQISRDRETFAKAQANHPGKQVRKAFLRYELVFDNNKSTYAFRLTGRSTANNRAAERVLQNTDVFYASELGFYLAAQDARRPGTGQLLTYPSPAALAVAYGKTVGTAADATNFPAPLDLEAFYSGQAQLTVDKAIELDGLDLRRARFVPSMQASGTVDKDAADDGAGLIPLVPGFALNGTKNAELQISLPTFNGVTPTFAATAANQEVIMVVLIRGYEVAGASGLSR